MVKSESKKFKDMLWATHGPFVIHDLMKSGMPKALATKKVLSRTKQASSILKKRLASEVIIPKNVRELFRKTMHAGCGGLSVVACEEIANDLRRNLKKFDNGDITGDELAHQCWGTEAWLRNFIIHGDKPNGKK